MKLSSLANVTDQRQLLRIVLVLVVVVAVQPFLWRFAQYRVSTVRDQQARNGQIAAVREQNQQIEQAIKTQQQLIDQLDIIAPRPTALNQVVERLEQLADKQQLRIDISSIKEVTSTSRRKAAVVTPVTAVIEIRGSVTAVLQYIEQLEHTPELTVVRSFTLKPNRLVIEPVASPLPSATPPPVVTDYSVKLEVIFFLKKIAS